MEYRGIIRNSSSPWASSILVVAKGDNDFRLVADYRRINESIMGNAWTIPNIETSMANLANPKFFSSFDLKKHFMESNSQKIVYQKVQLSPRGDCMST